MALYRCIGGNKFYANVGAIQSFTSSFTDVCQKGDLYVLILNGNNPTITGADVLETWDTYSASFPAKILKATGTSISVSGVTNGVYARIINTPQIKYETINITANVNIDITSKKDDLVIFPYIASSETFSLIANLQKSFDANAGNQRMAIFRLTSDGVATFKDSHAYKLIRIYK